MVNWENWRKTTFPLKIEDCKKAMDLGFIHIGKRDKDHRPTIIIDCTKLVEHVLEYTEKDIIDCVTFILTYSIDELLIPGAVETLNVIMDVTNLAVTSIPITMMSNICVALTGSFPTRIVRNFIFGCDFLMRNLYNTVYYLIPEFTRNSVVILNYGEYSEIMAQYYDLDCLPKKYGGTLPDEICEGYFPPDMTIVKQTMVTAEEKEILLAEAIVKRKEEPIRPTVDPNRVIEVEYY